MESGKALKRWRWGMNYLVLLLSLLGLLLLTGCRTELRKVMLSSDVDIFRYHAKECVNSMETFIRSLYAKNPKYEPDSAARIRKLKDIFEGRAFDAGVYGDKASHVILTAAFSNDTIYNDRVYLLGLGLYRSIKEAYGMTEEELFISGLQVPLPKLQKLHKNLSQVNWRLKTYRDEDGKLLFLANEAGEGDYLNMEFEVLMTETLTRVKDDVYLRGGLVGKYIFNMSTFFASIIM